MSNSIYESYKAAFINISTIFTSVANTIKKWYDWYEKNPETISAYIEVFINFALWCSATQKLIDNHIIFTDDISESLAETLYDCNDVNSVIEKYYFDNEEQKMNDLIYRCQHADQINDYSILYGQVINAYEIGYYHLACIGLLTIIDGVLTDISNVSNKDITRFKKRIEAVQHKLSNKIELNDIDRKCLFIYSAMDSFDKSIFSNSNLSGDEPDYANRHWILHGRARSPLTQYDFLQILLWLDAMIFIDNMCLEFESRKDDN